MPRVFKSMMEFCYPLQTQEVVSHLNLAFQITFKISSGPLNTIGKFRRCIFSGEEQYTTPHPCQQSGSGDDSLIIFLKDRHAVLTD